MELPPALVTFMCKCVWQDPGLGDIYSVLYIIGVDPLLLMLLLFFMFLNYPIYTYKISDIELVLMLKVSKQLAYLLHIQTKNNWTLTISSKILWYLEAKFYYWYFILFLCKGSYDSTWKISRHLKQNWRCCSNIKKISFF